MPELLHAKDQIASIEASIAEMNKTLHELREFVRFSESLESCFRVKLQAAGLSEEAIQAALDTQFGRTTTVETVPAKKRSPNRTDEEKRADLGLVENAILVCHDNQSSSELQVVTGLTCSQVAAAVKTLLEMGRVYKTGALRGTRYSYARDIK
jgi:hypothetical protein